MHLSADRIIKHFDSFLLGPVSLEIKSGITAITGRSGSGKTTLLMLLSGLVAPDSGAVLLNGSRIKGIPSSFGLVMQHPERQLFADTVIDDVCRASHHRHRILPSCRMQSSSFQHLLRRLTIRSGCIDDSFRKMTLKCRDNGSSKPTTLSIYNKYFHMSDDERKTEYGQSSLHYSLHSD